MRSRVTSLAAAALLALSLPSLPVHPAAQAAKPARADLKVTTGSVSVVNGQLTGSATLKNAGKKKAKGSTSSVQVDGTVVQSPRVSGIKPGKSKSVAFTVAAAPGVHSVTVCADAGGKVKESKEKNNCRSLGQVTVPPTQPTPPSTVPTHPIAGYPTNMVFKIGVAPGDYWLHVPTSYDDSHQTPTRLVVFLHGCGDTAQNQLATIENAVSLDSASYLVMAPGLGRDGSCFNTAPADQATLLAAIADVKTHFNIAPKNVVIGGYSAGGDLAARTAFAHATSFAGLMVMVGRPFQVSSGQRASELANAGWKLNVVIRAHVSDGSYPIANTRTDRDALLAAGFPTTYNEVAGDHSYGNPDLVYVFGQMNPAWSAP
jgi:predicted esterase